MFRRTVCLVALLTLCLACVAPASPFIHPPQDFCTPDEWLSEFPYPRNALIDFTTDISTWPFPDPDNANAYDLLPGLNYDLEGWDDPGLFPSDWFLIEEDLVGSVGWVATDPYLGSGRTGILILDNTAGAVAIDATLTWHLDNSLDSNRKKDIWSELVWAQGPASVLDIGLGVPTGYDVVVAETRNQEFLANNWLLADAYAQITPNPEWEDLMLLLTAAPGEFIMVDLWHTATECVPEPGTFALFSLGAVGLAVLRRRRTK